MKQPIQIGSLNNLNLNEDESYQGLSLSVDIERV